MMREILIMMRATGIAWGYAVTLGCLSAARLFWMDQAPDSGARASRFQVTAEAVLRTSPYIVLTASLFAILAIPLATWAVGSASWSLLKKYVYAFWLVLALYMVAFENADGLILISGAGLIILWFLMNHGSVNPARVHSKGSVRFQALLRTTDSKRSITILAILTVIACALSLFLFFGNGTKVYVSEIFAIYAVAAICQCLKTFAVIVHEQNAGPEEKR